MMETNARPATHSSLYSRVQNAVQANAFFRGVVGSFTLISLFAQVVNLENYEVARAINAIVIGWNKAAAFIGEMFGWLPFVPELDATIVNTIAFLLSVTIPSILGSVELVRPIWETRNSREWFVTMIVPPGLFLSLSFIFIVGPILFFSGNLEFLKQTAPEEFAENAFMIFMTQTQYISHVMVFLVMPFIVALLVKAYRAGVLVIAGTMFTVQVLYFAPVIGEWVKLFSDTMHGTG